MKNNHSLWSAAPLFLVLMIDGMGLGLLFPILNSLIMDPHNHFVANQISIPTREVMFSFLIAIFMLCWFFGAAILGDLSDSIGRKKSLIICLLGTFIGYFISGIAVIYSSFAWLLIGRIIAGFTAGSQAIAQATIVDISDPQHKARNLAYMISAISLGFVLGPIVGGLLSDSYLVHWFSLQTPLFFAAGVSLLNALLIWLAFKETFRTKTALRFQLTKALYMFADAFKIKRLRNLSIVFLIMIYAWGSYYSFISMFAFERYHADALQVSLVLTVVALGFISASAFLVDFLTAHFRLASIALISILVASVAAFVTLLPQQLFMWLAAFAIGCSISCAYSVLLTLFSNQVAADEQGWVMGVTGSIMALSFGLTTFFTGLIVRASIDYSMWICGVGLLVSATVLKVCSKNDEKDTRSSGSS